MVPPSVVALFSAIRLSLALSRSLGRLSAMPARASWMWSFFGDLKTEGFPEG